MMGAALNALANSTRLEIVRYLSDRQLGRSHKLDGWKVTKGTSESEICSHVANRSSKPFTITHHLHELEGVGLISIGRKDGEIVCTLRPHMFLELSTALRAIAKGIAKP